MIKTVEIKGEIYEIKKDDTDYILRDFAKNKSQDGSNFKWILQIKELPDAKKNIELKI